MPSPALPSRAALAGLLTCPEDGGLLSGWDGTAADASLRCASCGRGFPVREGVPCLLPERVRNGRGAAPDEEVTGKRREMAARDAQAGDYDRMLGLKLFSVPEIPLTLRYLAPEPDHLMLEAGCGTGRMTAAFARRVRGLVCVDFSLRSLMAARAKLPPESAAKVLFVQGDVGSLPLRGDAFDRVGSFQVLEHLPTEGARRRAMDELVRVLRPRTDGGRLALSAYRWGAPVSWTAAKQGQHAGGIPFFRSTWPELAALADAAGLDVAQHTGALLYHFLFWGRRRP